MCGPPFVRSQIVDSGKLPASREKFEAHKAALTSIRHRITNLKPAKVQINVLREAIVNIKDKGTKLEKRLLTARSECEAAVKALQFAQDEIIANNTNLVDT